MLAGGSGSVQVTGLDAFCSFDAPLKEGMKMMGLFPSAVNASWLIWYGLKFLWLAVVSTVLLSRGVAGGMFDATP